MKTLVVDGKTLSVERGTLLYDAAVAAGARIPALCRHEGLPHEGACRVCVVELVRRGSSRLVASCMFPVTEDGLEVRTDTERVRPRSVPRTARASGRRGRCPRIGGRLAG